MEQIPNSILVNKIKARSINEEDAGKAFDMLFERFAGWLYSMLYKLNYVRNNRRISNPYVLEDLVRDTFAKIWSNGLPANKNLDHDKVMARYLFKIAKNIFLDDHDGLYSKAKSKYGPVERPMLQEGKNISNRKREFEKFLGVNLSREQTKDYLGKLRSHMEGLEEMRLDILLTYLEFEMVGKNMPRAEMERLRNSYETSTKKINAVYHETLDEIGSLFVL